MHCLCISNRLRVLLLREDAIIEYVACVWCSYSTSLHFRSIHLLDLVDWFHCGLFSVKSSRYRCVQHLTPVELKRYNGVKAVHLRSELRLYACLSFPVLLVSSCVNFQTLSSRILSLRKSSSVLSLSAGRHSTSRNVPHFQVGLIDDVRALC